MSKYSLRRVLSFLLAVMMVCTLLPTAAFAEEGVEQPTAGEQTAATPDGEENQKPETPAVEEEKGEKTPEEPKQDVASVQSADGLNTEISTQALDTGHTLKVRFQVLYLDDTLYTGYRYGTAESTTFVCQYKTPHSDTGSTNHTIAISDIESAAGRADVESGYTISGWTKTASANPQVWPFTVKEPTGCMSG